MKKNRIRPFLYIFGPIVITFIGWVLVHLLFATKCAPDRCKPNLQRIYRLLSEYHRVADDSDERSNHHRNHIAERASEFVLDSDGADLFDAMENRLRAAKGIIPGEPAASLFCPDDPVALRMDGIDLSAVDFLFLLRISSYQIRSYNDSWVIIERQGIHEHHRHVLFPDGSVKNLTLCDASRYDPPDRFFYGYDRRTMITPRKGEERAETNTDSGEARFQRGARE